MSRHGYIDSYDYDEYDAILADGRWRGMVMSAIRGKRGQAFLKDILIGMDNLDKPELFANVLDESTPEHTCVCALGAGARNRNVDVTKIDPEHCDILADKLNIASCLAQEIAYMNDECGELNETPAQRFIRMRNWILSKIKKD